MSDARSRRRVIGAVLLGAFMAYLDATIVNLAFPSIERSFSDSSRSTLSWVLTAYFVVFAALLAPAGRLADLLGRRRLFAAGVVLFALGSLTCAVAPSVPVLLASRVVQAVGAAMLAPASLALILPQFRPDQRATAVALWGGSAALASAFGPPLGGALVELSDWRLIFVINPPIAAIVLYMLRGVPESRGERDDPLPRPIATVLLMLGIGVLTLAIVQGNDWGWGSGRTIGAFAASVVFLAGFAYINLRDPGAIVPPSAFRLPAFRAANAASLLFGTAFFGLLFVDVLFLVTVWGYSIIGAGLAVMVGALVTAMVAVPGGRLADRFGYPATVIPGAILFAAGSVWLAGQTGAHPSFGAAWVPGMVLTGAGIGLGVPALAGAAVEALPDGDFGLANALNATTRQLGGAVGIAIVVAIVGSTRVDPSPGSFHVAWLAIAGIALATLPFNRALRGLTEQREPAPIGGLEPRVAAEPEVAAPG